LTRAGGGRWGRALRLIGLASGAAALLVAGLAVVSAGESGGPGASAREITQRVPALAVVVAVAGCATFLGLKGLALALAARAAGCSAGALGATRALVEGIAVEAVTWPGKLWADGYRVARLSERGEPRAFASAAVGVGLARAGALVSGAVLGAAALLTLGADARLSAGTAEGGVGLVWVKLTLAVGLVACLVLGVWGARRLRLLSARVGWRGAAAGAGASTVASAVDSLCVAVVCWLVCGADPLAVWPHYVLVGLVASATGLPLGLGVVDAGLYAVLTQRLGVAPAAALAGVVVCRALGPGLSLLLGAALLLARGMAWPAGTPEQRAGGPGDAARGGPGGPVPAGEALGPRAGEFLGGRAA
jgi:hypothetical protein